ncbi:MAG TPA: hypothetical protein VGJ63_05540 [Micromonosporaceae bacterium]
MKRVGVLAAAVLLAAAGCGAGEPTATPSAATSSAAPTGSTSAPAPASATPTGSAPAVLEFTVDGAGPYRLGAMLADLQAAGQLDEVATAAACPGNTTARGTGTWEGIRLSFHSDGELYLAVNRSPSIPTPSGAWLGTTLAQLKSIYKGIPGQDLKRGTANAHLVTTMSGRGILFELDSGKKVVSMAAAQAGYLKSSFVGGTGFC